jgi:hypothetical protein
MIMLKISGVMVSKFSRPGGSKEFVHPCVYTDKGLVSTLKRTQCASIIEIKRRKLYTVTIAVYL